MKHYSYFLIIGLLIFAQSAWGQCAFYESRPRTELVIEPGRPIVDNSKSRKNFPMMAKDTTLGLTVANIKHQVEISTEIKDTSDHHHCLRPTKIKVTVAIPKLDVYIDKKYKPGSCEYSVVSQHEQKHVRIHQDTLKAGRSRLQAALDSAARKLRPVSVQSKAGAQASTDQFLRAITQDIVPVIKAIQDETEAKNKQLDTPQSYKADSRKCHNW